jgi:hypothetical protein
MSKSFLSSLSVAALAGGAMLALELEAVSDQVELTSPFGSYPQARK